MWRKEKVERGKTLKEAYKTHQLWGKIEWDPTRLAKDAH